MTLKIGMEDVIYLLEINLCLENLNIVPKIKRNLISISLLIEKLYSVIFFLQMNHSFLRIVYIFVRLSLKKYLYVLRPNEAKTFLNHEMFKTANTQNKRQRSSPNTNTIFGI